MKHRADLTNAIINAIVNASHLKCCDYGFSDEILLGNSSILFNTKERL